MMMTTTMAMNMILLTSKYHMLRSIYPACLNILKILLAQRTFGVGCLNSKTYRHPNISWFGANMLIWSPLRTLHPDVIQISIYIYIFYILWILWISCSLNDFNSLHSNSGEFFMSNSGATAFSHSPWPIQRVDPLGPALSSGRIAGGTSWRQVQPILVKRAVRGPRNHDFISSIHEKYWKVVT